MDRMDLLEPVPVQCVVLGDGGVGKTYMMTSYQNQSFPLEPIYNVQEHFKAKFAISTKLILLNTIITSGQDEYDHVRRTTYAGAKVFIVCFSLINKVSMNNVAEKWVPEIRSYAPNASYILVGTKADLRRRADVIHRLNEYNEKPVTSEEGEALAKKVGAKRYVECSALTQQGLQTVIDCVIEDFIPAPKKASKKGKFKAKISCTLL